MKTSGKAILLFFAILNIALYIAIVILSGDPFWIVNTGDWDGRHRVIAVLVIFALNVVAIQAVIEVDEDNKEVDKPED